MEDWRADVGSANLEDCDGQCRRGGGRGRGFGHAALLLAAIPSRGAGGRMEYRLPFWKFYYTIETNKISTAEPFIAPARAAAGAHCGTNRRCADRRRAHGRSEEHTSELQSLMRISYAVFCLKKNTKDIIHN